MLTMLADDEDLFEAIKSGAGGYLLKTQDTEDFFSLLADLARGEAALSPWLATRILHEFGRQSELAAAIGKERALLSPRETQVLSPVAQGLTYKEVGAKLCLLSERSNITWARSSRACMLQIARRWSSMPAVRG
ncbi:MAG: hypothetical protein LAO03_23360 [Acidobacteriia bacterium]|nr:hypothetical protein [Terriglobia bacterium]